MEMKLVEIASVFEKVRVVRAVCPNALALAVTYIDFDHPSETDEIVSESMEKDGVVETPLQVANTYTSLTWKIPPPLSPAHSPDFKWGEREGAKEVADIYMIYSEIVHWRHNHFKIPSGKQVKVLARKWPDFSASTRRHLHLREWPSKLPWFSQP